ncbi:transcriptional regulator [Paenibacillus sp. FSL H8-0548]|uniref:MerR family DNA-binding transcriptional regulator n=1 Tax=Paenibacillus sp. FSL H8-0548 TaxID=1920422 RepID=UPI00096C5C36|nr:MerR family DNA-binding transcriptional regulator [Paenibacillus sp. FSL H8-0548]OMF33851.1 transcriptional regulator [Paenibacillus sp. FSL H8-0548]
MKGIEIAKKLNISTSALRHYESWGLVPEIERASNGYRIYTKEHEAYFQCIRALIPGFGMDLVRTIMPLIIKREKLGILWKINKAQVNLHAEKETVLRAIEMIDLIENAEFPKYLSKSAFTIGEVAKLANVSASSIRHWEKEGLIKPNRQKESGFRIYFRTDIRKVLIIRTVQRVAYSLDIVREVLLGLDNNDVSQAKEIAYQSLQFIDYALVEQVRGIAYLQNLFEVISTGNTFVADESS